MGRISHVDMSAINELLLITQAAHLQKHHGKPLEGQERSVIRADFIRNRLEQCRGSNN
jgi:protein-arginine kinase